MTTIILSGCGGKMGSVINDIVRDKSDAYSIVYGVDAKGESTGSYPVYKSFGEVPVDAPKADVIIDFSHFSVIRSLVDFAVSTKTPAVIATTGISAEDIEYIKEQSADVPFFRSANMSIGICLLKNLAAKAAAFLGPDFDIEIVEKHHNRKIDAPSGTALALADAVNGACDDKYHYVYDRSQRRMRREPTEIGISAVRGGNIVGDHDVIFAGSNEVITLSHSAISRSVFADGALVAGAFLKSQAPGMYSMDDII